MAKPFSRLLVAYDGTAPAAAALDFGLQVAEHYGGSVAVVTACKTALPAVLPLDAAHATLDAAKDAFVAALPSSLRALVDAVATSLAGRTIAVALEFATAAAPAAILDAARRWSADAIVIGTHGRSGFARTVLGNTAESVARLAAVPVVVVGDTARSLDHGLRRVVVGIPSTSDNEAPLALAVALARERGVHVVLAAVTAAQLVEARGAGYRYDPAPLFRELRAAAKDDLEKALQDAEEAGIAPDTSVIEDGDVALGLLRAARLHDADAIVVGAHGHGALNRFFFGDAAGEMTREAPIPVMIVPKAAPSCR